MTGRATSDDKQRRTELALLSAVVSRSYWKQGFLVGGRTRARTWDPLIKSQLRIKNNQYLTGRTAGLNRLKTGIRRTIVVHRGQKAHRASKSLFQHSLSQRFPNGPEI